MADETPPQRQITIKLPANTKAIADVLFKIAVIGYLIWSGNKTYNVDTLLTGTVAPTVVATHATSVDNNRELKDVKDHAQEAAAAARETKAKADKIDSTMLKK